MTGAHESVRRVAVIGTGIIGTEELARYDEADVTGRRGLVLDALLAAKA